MSVVKVKSIIGVVILLLVGHYSFCQTKKRKTLTDTIPLAPPSLTISNNCNYGISSILIELEDDTTLTSKKVYLYKFNKNQSPLDTINTDTLLFIESFTFEDLEKRQFSLLPKQEGIYCIQLEGKKGDTLRKSLYSNKVFITYCSSIEFATVFDKTKTEVYNLKKIFNIQIIEFSIFDRIGETVYTHNNNTISWQGKCANGLDCPSGIYYYHCEFIDVADDNKKKSKSGMIELKN